MSAEACRSQILARLDQTKSDMDSYYHAFLQLEHVVSQVVANQAELARIVAALQVRAPAGAPARRRLPPRRASGGGGASSARTGSGGTGAATPTASPRAWPAPPSPA